MFLDNNRKPYDGGEHKNSVVGKQGKAEFSLCFSAEHSKLATLTVTDQNEPITIKILYLPSYNVHKVRHWSCTVKSQPHPGTVFLNIENM